MGNTKESTTARIHGMTFAGVYPLYVQKAERKGRTREEVNEVVRWLTGYDSTALQAQIDRRSDFVTFFSEAPCIHPDSAKITGSICGYRVEQIQDRTEQLVRYLDKLVDELAKGRPMEKILRKQAGDRQAPSLVRSRLHAP
jgi:hypothetical protein